jgi:hypothetical protein
VRCGLVLGRHFKPHKPATHRPGIMIDNKLDKHNNLKDKMWYAPGSTLAAHRATVGDVSAGVLGVARRDVLDADVRELLHHKYIGGLEYIYRYYALKEDADEVCLCQPYISVLATFR